MSIVHIIKMAEALLGRLMNYVSLREEVEFCFRLSKDRCL